MDGCQTGESVDSKELSIIADRKSTIDEREVFERSFSQLVVVGNGKSATDSLKGVHVERREFIFME
jgi:hypothetical protein